MYGDINMILVYHQLRIIAKKDGQTRTFKSDTSPGIFPYDFD